MQFDLGAEMFASGSSVTSVFPQFVRGLLYEGRIAVGDAPLAAHDTSAAHTEAAAVVVEFEAEYRSSLPAGVPELAPNAAIWAAKNFYAASQAAVYRFLDADELARRIVPPPEPIGPTTHYSVDIVFRFLPDLLRFANRESPADPLVDTLKDWARQWPLSSVGVAELGAVETDAIASQPALLQMYADRVIARADLARLDAQAVREAVGASLGGFPALAVRVADELKRGSQGSVHE